jgi:ABC-type multidrug transport system fused ATPase/permease subunit
MSEKIPQHRHCAKCGKAHLGEGRFCSEECQTVSSDSLKKKKRQLLMLYGITLAILIVAGASRVHANLLSVGTVAAFLQLVRRFFQPLQDLSVKYNILQTAMASSERIFTLLDTVPSVPDTGEPVEVMKGRRGVEVAFEDVWFAYDLAHIARQKAGIGADEPCALERFEVRRHK